MLHIGQTDDAACRSRSISFDQPASAVGSDVPPVWFVLVKHGAARRARQAGEGGQRAALDRRQPRVGPEPGHVGERVRVVIGVDDRDHQRGVALGGQAVRGPDVRSIEVDGLGRRGGDGERRLRPGRRPRSRRGRRSGRSRCSARGPARAGRTRASPCDSNWAPSRPRAGPRRPRRGGGRRRRSPQAAGRT